MWSQCSNPQAVSEPQERVSTLLSIESIAMNTLLLNYIYLFPAETETTIINNQMSPGTEISASAQGGFTA